MSPSEAYVILHILHGQSFHWKKEFWKSVRKHRSNCLGHFWQQFGTQKFPKNKIASLGENMKYNVPARKNVSGFWNLSYQFLLKVSCEIRSLSHTFFACLYQVSNQPITGPKRVFKSMEFLVVPRGLQVTMLPLSSRVMVCLCSLVSLRIDQFFRTT